MWVFFKFYLSFIKLMIYFLIIANGTILNNVNNNEQQNVMAWDVDSLNGGLFIDVQLVLY